MKKYAKEQISGFEAVLGIKKIKIMVKKFASYLANR